MFKNFCYLLAIAVVLTSCSGNTVRIKRTNFKDEVQRAQNLVFTFNKELVRDSGKMNKWDTSAYFRFEPNIPGKFMWTAKNELTFSPSSLMAPSSSFKAFPAKSLLKFSNPDYSVTTEPVLFHTPYLAFIGINSYWALSDDPAAKVEVRLQLNFNCPVSPAKLKTLLSIQIEGKDVPFRLLTLEDNETVELAITYDIASPDQTADGKVIIAKGMKCAGGNTPSEEDIEQGFSIPSKDELQVSEIVTGFDKGKGVISIYTTQPVISEGLSGLVSTDPKVDFEIELLPNGFSLKGDFKENQAYSVRVAPALKSVFGRELGQEYVETVAFGTLEPYIGFLEKNSTYLSSKGNRNLAVSIINIPTVKVSVFKIFENNIQHYMRQGKSWDYVMENDEYYDINGYPFDENNGKPIMSKVVPTRSLPKSGNSYLLNLDLDELQFNDAYKGIYLVKVESTEKRWLQDVQLLSLSDLGMVVKEGTSDVMVFVNSLRDAEPVKGARVEFVSTNNQKVYSAVSDNKGVAVFRNVAQAAPGFKLGMITARFDNDFNFLLFNNTRIETSRFDVGGKHTNDLDYDVFIYGDRNLYRPGDSVHLNCIVRTLDWQTVRDIPVKIKLISPGGKEFLAQRKMLNSSGAVESSFYIPRQAMTGTYTMEVLSANDLLLSTRRISVEEFVPDRIKVKVNTEKTYYLPGESIKTAVQADNLFGTPAAGRKVESELRLARKNIQPAGFGDYDFSIHSENMPVLTSIVQQGQTDDKGTSALSLQIPQYKDIGLVQGSVFTTVFDETGRPVNRINVIEIPTQNVFCGIRHFDNWISTRKPLNLKFSAVGSNGKVLPAAVARIRITYFRYETVIEKGYNRYDYVSQRKETVMLSKDISMHSNGFDLPFTPPRSGEYEVRIMSPGSDNYVSATFYAYGWGDTDYTSFEVSREGEIAISSDKPNYKPGEKAKILLKAPFDGRLLVTLEQNNVLDYKYLTLQNKSASFDLDIKQGQLPNVYISATAFRKTSDAFMPLTVAHGIYSVKVDDPSLRMSVSIDAPEKSRSNIKQSVTVHTIPNAEVTIAVVDEGILQVTDFKSPDPYNWFYQKRALEVNSYDIYAQLYPEMHAGSSVAGGEGFDLSKRINPLTGQRVKLISKWSGILRSNSSGNCTYSFAIPEFSGALRVMAVTYKDKKFGSSEKMIKVADPVVISMALPRFLSPGDKAAVTVNLTNTTPKDASSICQVCTAGPVMFLGSKSQTCTLKAGSEQAVHFDLIAANAVGNARVSVLVSSMGQSFRQEITLPVRPPSGLAFITGSGAVTAGSTRTFKVSNELIPLGATSTLVLSKSPAGRFMRNLNELVRYPYGCLEQTVSAAFPQIYFKDMIALMKDNKEFSGNIYENPDHNVQQAILKAESMQLYNGGFSLWENGGSAQWWASAYATQFLFEAEKAGFEVDRKVLNSAFQFLEQKVKERETDTWFYYENNVRKSRIVPKPEIFYSLYVLALADRPSIASMNFYRSQAGSLTPESRYLLASSYMLAGDRKNFLALLPRSFGNEKAEPVFGGYMGSYLRDQAIALNALLEADPNNPQVGELMRQVTEGVSVTNACYSTQEDAFALLAVGKQARRANASNLTAQVLVDGKSTGTYSNADCKFKNDLLGKTLSISPKGNGILYYSYELSGLRAKVATGSEDSYLKVRKRYLDRNGKEYPSNSFKINDLVVVEIAAEAPTGKTVENVAVTDLLPACFEIENSRLVAEREMSWMKKHVVPEYTDIRDDRISFFSSLTGSVSYFYYTVRVVSKGTYTLGPVSADAMYNGSYHSYSGSRTITVQ